MPFRGFDPTKSSDHLEGSLVTPSRSETVPTLFCWQRPAQNFAALVAWKSLERRSCT